MDWLMNTPAGLAVRLLLAIGVFVLLAGIDLAIHRRQATRWREYLILATAVLAAMAYGVANDQITLTLSPHYFYYHKGLAGRLGYGEPVVNAEARWEAAKVGMMATWTAGLLAGVLALWANNPRQDRPRLSTPRMVSMVWIPLSSAGTLGVLGGCIGALWQPAWLLAGQEPASIGPAGRFSAVWFAHLGGYLGGVLGAGLMAVSILRARARQADAPPPATN
jgi:hypothetical protein